MGSPKKPKDLLFANGIAGPMTFTFAKVLSIEKNKLVEIIQSNGGEVVEYDNRDRFTIVLTKNNDTNAEIRFNVKYIKDCKAKNKILPLENYRLDKSVNVGCHYSKPLGSTSCIFFKLMQRKRCKKHKIPSGQKADVVDATRHEVALKKQVKLIKSQIHVERMPRVKSELDLPERSMEESQEDQPLETETYYERSQSLLRRRAK